MTIKHWSKVKAFLGKAWEAFKKIFAWSPIGILLRSFRPGFQLLKHIILTPVHAAQWAWQKLKEIFSWSSEQSLSDGLFKPFGLLKLAIFGPLFAARQAWNGLKKVFAWSPRETLKSSWAGLKIGFKSTFDFVAKLAGSKLDWIENKMSRVLKGARGAWQKVKAIGKSIKGGSDAKTITAVRSARGASAGVTDGLSDYGSMTLATPAISQSYMTPGPSYMSGQSPNKTANHTSKYDLHVHAAPGMDIDELVAKFRRELEDQERKKMRATSNSLHDLDD